MARLDKIRATGVEKKCFGHALGHTKYGHQNFFIKVESAHPQADPGDGYELSLNPREARKLFRKLEQFLSEAVGETGE